MFLPLVASAQDLQMNFKESDFFGAYDHQTYIKNGKYIHIDAHYKYDEKKDNVLPFVPEFYSMQLTNGKTQEIVETLKMYGVQNWKKQYPEDASGLICDGLSYNMYIKTHEFEVVSVGYCRFPENYKKVVEYLASIHQHLTSQASGTP